MAAPLDLQTRAVGEVFGVTDGLRASVGGNGWFSVSSAGDLSYLPGGRVGVDRRIVTVDQHGVVSPFITEPRPYQQSFRVSPDGRRAAVVVPNAKGTYEIWVGEVGRPGLRRVLAYTNADCMDLEWSPDGQSLASTRVARDKDDGVYHQQFGARKTPRAMLTVGPDFGPIAPTSWLPGIAPASS